MFKQLLAVAIFGGLAGGLIVHWTADKPQTEAKASKPQTESMEIKAKSISLVDEQGNVRLALRCNPVNGTTAISFYDAGSTNVRILLGVHDSTPELDFLDGTNTAPRVALSAVPNGAVRFAVQDSDRNHGIILASALDGKTALLFNGHGSQHMAVFGLNQNDEPHLTIYKSDGKVAKTIP